MVVLFARHGPNQTLMILVLSIAMLSIEMVASTTPSKCSTHENGHASASTKTADGERLIFFTSRQHLYQMKVCFCICIWPANLTIIKSHELIFPRVKFRTTDNTTVTCILALLLREYRLWSFFYVYVCLFLSPCPSLQVPLSLPLFIGIFTETWFLLVVYLVLLILVTGVVLFFSFCVTFGFV